MPLEIILRLRRNFNHPALLLCAGDPYNSNKGAAKFQARKIFRSERQRNKNYDIKGDMFKTKTQKRAVYEKIKFEVKIGGERQRMGKFKTAASRD